MRPAPQGRLAPHCFPDAVGWPIVRAVPVAAASGAPQEVPRGTASMDEPDEITPDTAPVTVGPAPLAWDEFEGRLAASLGRMAAGQFLILSSRPDDDDTIYYVQFAQGGRAGFRAEAVGNTFLNGGGQLTPDQEERIAALAWQFPDPATKRSENFSREWPMPVPFVEVARLAIRTLREVYGVGEPADLVYRRFARGGREIADPHLGIAPEHPTRPSRGGQTGASTPEELRPLLEAALRSFLGLETIAPDADGDYPVRLGSITALVRILPSSAPIVRVFAPLLAGTPGSPELLGALNGLNTELSFCRVLWVGGQVIVATEVRAADVTTDSVAFACLVVEAAAQPVLAQVMERLEPPAAATAPPERMN